LGYRRECITSRASSDAWEKGKECSRAYKSGLAPS
jgi:hypothetical protein